MRISDLARISGVPLPTIKFYIRERLLPPGRPTARNQAEYGEEHLARLRLIRVLAGIGRLSLSSVRRVLAALDDRSLALGAQCRATIWALFPDQPEEDDTPDVGPARVQVDAFIDRLGWEVDVASPGRDTLAHVLTALQQLDADCDIELFSEHAESAERIVTHEFQYESAHSATAMAVWNVLSEVAFEAMRRMAQESYLARRYASPAEQPATA
ncbi:MerR family transcriptional regulator [Micromonospora sp. WMMD723]|jgi:DNA-binding transcriptional MerR regulator|uniref:MerR family transcriptional regulator n=1 Tax=unclassified Micromonospora TaxID=2617518 RepID=UPI003B928131